MKAPTQATRLGVRRTSGKNNSREALMTEELETRDVNLRAWMLLQRTRHLMFRCEDRVVLEFGITAEQYSVLTAIKQLDDPVRPTDVGRVLGHKVNTVSMIVDRMVNAGLITRIRDLPDRRAVRLVITKRGERALEPATTAASRLVEDIMSSLTKSETETLIGLLEKVRDRAARHLTSETTPRDRRLSA